MPMFKVTEGDGAVHWVIAPDAATALAFAWTYDYLANGTQEADNDWTCAQIPPTTALVVTVDDFRLRHTAEEWCAIYGHKPCEVACSEW